MWNIIKCSQKTRNWNVSFTVAEKNAHWVCGNWLTDLISHLNSSDCVWFKSSNVSDCQERTNSCFGSCLQRLSFEKWGLNVKFCRVAKKRLVDVDTAILPLSVQTPDRILHKQDQGWDPILRNYLIAPVFSSEEEQTSKRSCEVCKCETLPWKRLQRQHP